MSPKQSRWFGEENCFQGGLNRIGAGTRWWLRSSRDSLLAATHRTNLLRGKEARSGIIVSAFSTSKQKDSLEKAGGKNHLTPATRPFNTQWPCVGPWSWLPSRPLLQP
jgi:hypothetical protein